MADPTTAAEAFVQVRAFVDNLPAEGDAISGYVRGGVRYELTGAALQALLTERQQLMDGRETKRGNAQACAEESRAELEQMRRERDAAQDNLARATTELERVLQIPAGRELTDDEVQAVLDCFTMPTGRLEYVNGEDVQAEHAIDLIIALVSLAPCRKDRFGNCLAHGEFPAPGTDCPHALARAFLAGARRGWRQTLEKDPGVS